MDCCSNSKPPLERLRNLCISCLVLDCIFILIYGLTALSSASISRKTVCYEAHGYTWHNTITFTFAISAFAAAIGGRVHSSISCSSPAMTEQQLNAVLRFAHGLIIWTFVAAVLEAIAYRKEPLQCSDAYYGTSDRTYTADGKSSQDTSHLAWQVIYPLLWVAWVTFTVAAAVLSKRIVPMLPELNAVATVAQQSQSTPQTVGVPVQELPTGQPVPSAAFGTSPGAPGGPCATVTGSPCSPAGGSAAEQPAASPWEQGTVSGGSLVAQGRPVAGSIPDPEKGGGAGAGGKTV